MKPGPVGLFCRIARTITKNLLPITFAEKISDILCFYAFANRQCPQRHYVFISSRLSAALVRSFGQILLPRYLMNGLSNLDETYKK